MKPAVDYCAVPSASNAPPPARKIILDRERLRDGARAGEPTAHFVLVLNDGGETETVWCGFSHAAALDAATQWTSAGAELVDLQSAGRHG